MRTFRLNKLVRDNLVDMMKGRGQTAKYRTLTGDEYAAEPDRFTEVTKAGMHE